MSISESNFDLIIRGGIVFEGSSAESAGYRADVGVTEGVITAVGDLSRAESVEVCDAAGINAVLVNGKYAMKDGELTGDLAGRLLRKGKRE